MFIMFPDQRNYTYNVILTEYFMNVLPYAEMYCLRYKEITKLFDIIQQFIEKCT